MSIGDILLVEDELLIQKSLQKLFERKGAKVTALANGRDAIGLIAKQKFTRIVCDLMLQDITGFDIIEESKKYLSDEEISSTFVIITAYSSDQVLTKAQAYGCPVLKKPFEDLNQALNIILNK